MVVTIGILWTGGEGLDGNEEDKEDIVGGNLAGVDRNRRIAYRHVISLF